MGQTLDPSVVRRLAFIRFLYMQGLEQAQRPQPLAATALLCFHNAVEMFLLLTAEHLDVSLARNTSFEGYWDQIAQSRQLPGRVAMRRMNRDRVSFKHYGSIPSTESLERSRSDVTAFLTEATRLVFAADFSSLDMLDLVTQPKTLSLLRRAEERAMRGDYGRAIIDLADAFDELLTDYAERKRISDGDTAYSFGADHLIDVLKRERDTHPGKLPRVVFNIVSAVKEMQRAIQVLAVGLDYRRYARFAMLAWSPMPEAFKLHDYGTKVYGQRPWLTDEDYQFCKQFVVEAALKLSEMDFDLDIRHLEEINKINPRKDGELDLGSLAWPTDD